MGLKDDVLPSGLRGKESACSAGAAQDGSSILGLGRPLEEGTATHSSILAWRIPRTEEPGETVVHRVTINRQRIILSSVRESK